MTPRSYTITLREKREIAEQTIAASFVADQEVVFRPGQFATLRNPSLSPQEATRVFSFASAPSDTELLFVWRHSDSVWKRAAAEMAPGETLTMIAPAGHATIPEGLPVVFLVAGIGITPVRSIVRDARYTGVKTDFVLLYSNRSRASTAFFDEFSRYNSEGVCRTVFTMTDDNQWNGERSMIDVECVRRHVPDIARRHIYIVGAGGFVRAMEGVVAQLGIAKDRIICDNFGGA